MKIKKISDSHRELPDLDRLGLSHNKFCDLTHLSKSGSFKKGKVLSIDGATHPTTLVPPKLKYLEDAEALTDLSGLLRLVYFRIPVNSVKIIVVETHVSFLFL